MKLKYQDPSLKVVCSKLRSLKTMPGLEVCNRLCLSLSTAPETVKQHPRLQYAILMPWIQGQSWFNVLCSGTSHSIPKDTPVNYRPLVSDPTKKSDVEPIKWVSLDKALPDMGEQ